MPNFRYILNTNYYKVAAAMILTGLGAGVYSFLLHKGVDHIVEELGTGLSFDLQTYFTAIFIALLSYLATKFFFKDTNGSGIPQVKLSLTAYKGKMPKRMSFGKFITSFLTLCSGLSFGKEGPLVTISAAWGRLVCYAFRLNREVTKTLVTSGATAGLAAAFNTPIAAVVFTIEEILGELNTKYLGPIIVTAVIASVTSYELLDKKSTFVTLHYGFHHWWHLFLYMLLGAALSIVGFIFVRSIILAKSIRNKYFQKSDFLFVIVAVSLAGIASQFSPEVLGDGTKTINQLLLGGIETPLKTLAIIFALKFILSTSAYSTGLSGGLFMPVLFLGALGGAVFALILQYLGFQNIEIGVFSLLGMTSLLVAVIRTPFTAFVMLFEMTRGYELILPLMISSVTAYWISHLFSDESVYESVAEHEGVHIPTPRDNECLTEMSVEGCMIKDVKTLDYQTKVTDLKELISQFDYGGFPVLKQGLLIGVINRREIRTYLDNEDLQVGDIIKHALITIYPDQSLLVALDRMKRFEIGRLPVVSRFNDKHLLGIITPEDIVNYLGLTKESSDS
jgi:CIC family chloride channel protein